MHRIRLSFAALFVLAAAAVGPTAAQAAESDFTACTRYIPAAEQAYGIPRGILHAISVVESGYQGWPWPWTLNIDGQGLYAPSLQSALSRMTRRDGSLHQDMAVGCMQIFVRYHGDKFASAQEMIDPRFNVWYAARYLSDLYRQYGSWTEAVARYHSSLRLYQIQYLCSVVQKRVSLGYQARTPWYVSACMGRKFEPEPTPSQFRAMAAAKRTGKTAAAQTAAAKPLLTYGGQRVYETDSLESGHITSATPDTGGFGGAARVAQAYDSDQN